MLEDQIEKFSKAFYLVSIDSVNDDTNEYVYIIEPKAKTDTVKIIDIVHGINQGNKVFVIEGQQKVDL